MTDLRTLADRDRIGIVVGDHGSRRAESNRRHEDFAAEWKLRSGYTIVEAAHIRQRCACSPSRRDFWPAMYQRCTNPSVNRGEYWGTAGT